MRVVFESVLAALPEEEDEDLHAEASDSTMATDAEAFTQTIAEPVREVLEGFEDLADQDQD